MASPKTTRRRARPAVVGLVLGIFLVLLGIALWPMGSSAPRPVERAPRSARVDEPAQPQPPGAAPRNADAVEHASDGVPVVSPGPQAALPDAAVHPHPITAEHERIYRENNLVAALNLAVDLKDAARLRELIARYRAEYPQDEYVLQEGYAIIADCLEHRDEATRARAQAFWNTQIRSQTRRYVRRHCLDD